MLAKDHDSIPASVSGFLFSLAFALFTLLISSSSWAAALVNATGTPAISISMPAVAQNYWTPFQGKVTFNNSMFANAYGRASIRVLKGGRIIWRTNFIEATTTPSIDLASFGEMPTGQWSNGTFTVEVTASEPTYD
ncbi:MAG: hypothetical protein Q9M29_06020, partial [Mariprofundaceae bacterium]|nr:hypothetical protein [Mariprofundaceae bacterium]